MTKGGLLSPRRTGRADFPHPALLKTSGRGFRRFDSQKLEPEPLQMFVQRHPLRQLVRTLAAMMLQVIRQPIAEMPVDIPIRLSRVSHRKVAPPAFQLPIQPFHPSRDRRATLTAIRQLIDPIPFPL